jgi:hypothetical protein
VCSLSLRTRRVWTGFHMDWFTPRFPHLCFFFSSRIRVHVGASKPRRGRLESHDSSAPFKHAQALPLARPEEMCGEGGGAQPEPACSCTARPGVPSTIPAHSRVPCTPPPAAVELIIVYSWLVVGEHAQVQHRERRDELRQTAGVRAGSGRSANEGRRGGARRGGAVCPGRFASRLTVMQ